MRDDNKRNRGFGQRDMMDRFSDSVSSMFSRKSRNTDNDDDLLMAFSGGDNDDFYVDESVQRRTPARPMPKGNPKGNPKANTKPKKKKTKMPVSPFVRKVRNIVTSCAIVSVVLIICVVLSLTVLFKTQNYEISGNTVYEEKDIIKTCGISKNENIFLANKHAAEKRLKKEYAYIEQADVSFNIPDTITIDITEAVPAYIVKVSDKNYLVCSSKGRVLEKTSTKKGYELPIFVGSDITNGDIGDYVKFEDKKTLDIINSVVTVFTDNGYTGITEIDATNTSNITFTYDNRIKVKLGLPEDISYKVRTAMTIITEKIDLNGSDATKGELDVSNCNTTKKSYFRDQSLIDAEKETEAPTETETVAHVDNDYDGYDDYTGEVIEEIKPVEEETEAPLSVEDWYLG